MTSPTRSFFTGLPSALVLSGGFIAAALIVTQAWSRYTESQFVEARGSARMNVKSDLVVLSGEITVEAPSLAEAQASLDETLKKVEGFLKENGLKGLSISAVHISEQKAEVVEKEARFRRTNAYELSRTFQVESTDVDNAPAIIERSCKLIAQGVPLQWKQPLYLYTRAGEAKIELLAAATRDARMRAEQIAGQGSRKVLRLRTATMGVFQITPPHSGEVSWEGCNDKTSLEKTIFVTVGARFALD